MTLSPIDHWPEVRSWLAFAISSMALLVSIGSYRRGERHRVQALREADLKAFEAFYLTLVEYLRQVNNHRAILLGIINEGGSPDMKGVLRLPQQYPHWPLLPGKAAKPSAVALGLCHEAYMDVSVLDDRMRRQASTELISDAHSHAQESITRASLGLDALGGTLLVERERLRTVSRCWPWWPRRKARPDP